MLRIYGASDDLVELEGIVDQELGCYGVAKIRVGTDEGGVDVLMAYAPFRGGGGTWAAMLAPLDEGVPIPWPVAIKHRERRGEVEYSVVVEIDCPTGTPVSRERGPWKQFIDGGE